jgi:glyoxylase-like metal-dependent hydrolase (beta-lactamase superfamily II)
LELPGSPRVIAVPGHSPGSLAFHVPNVDAVFVGDALTTGHVLTGELGPQPAPFTQDIEAAMDSLAALEPTGASWVLPGHGPPWHGGIREAVRLVRASAGMPPATRNGMTDQPDDGTRVDEPKGAPPDHDLIFDPDMTDADEANIPQDSRADPNADEERER